MCFKVHEDRACTECEWTDLFDFVVHCQTIREKGKDDGMMDSDECDAVKKNEIVEVVGGSYICDDCKLQLLAQHTKSDQHRDYVQHHDSDQHQHSGLNISQGCWDNQQTYNGHYEPRTPPQDAQEAQSTSEAIPERHHSDSPFATFAPENNELFPEDVPQFPTVSEERFDDGLRYSPASETAMVNVRAADYTSGNRGGGPRAWPGAPQAPRGNGRASPHMLPRLRTNWSVHPNIDNGDAGHHAHGQYAQGYHAQRHDGQWPPQPLVLLDRHSDDQLPPQVLWPPPDDPQWMPGSSQWQ